MFSFAHCVQKCIKNKKAYLRERVGESRVRVRGVRERQQDSTRDSKREREVEGERGGGRERWKEREGGKK